MFKVTGILASIVFVLAIGCSGPSVSSISCETIAEKACEPDTGTQAVSSITCEEIAEYWTGKTAPRFNIVNDSNTYFNLEVLSINDVSESQRVDEEIAGFVVCDADASFADGSKNEVELKYIKILKGKGEFKGLNGKGWYEFKPVRLAQRTAAADSKAKTPTHVRQTPTPTVKPRPTLLTREIFDPSVIPNNVISVTTGELIELYDSNPLAADATYRGKYADIRGTIQSISQAGDDIDVKLKWGTTDSWVNVVCKASDIESVLLLGKGDQIAVTGKIKGVTGVMDIVVDDCMGNPVEFAKTLFRQGMSVCEQCWLDLYVQDFTKSGPLTWLYGSWSGLAESTNIYHAHSYFTLAIELTDLALASTPDDQYAKLIQIEAYRQRANVSWLYSGKDDYLRGPNHIEEARADIDKVLESDFVNAQDYFVRGMLAYRYIAPHAAVSEVGMLQAHQMAVEYFDLAIKLDPEHANAHFSLGNAYINIGDLYSKQRNSFGAMEYRDKAISALTEAIELGKVEGYISRGSLDSSSGHLEKRESDWDTACSLDQSLYPCNNKHEWKN
jgi:hypothetical protein